MEQRRHNGIDLWSTVDWYANDKGLWWENGQTALNDKTYADQVISQTGFQKPLSSLSTKVVDDYFKSYNKLGLISHNDSSRKLIDGSHSHIIVAVILWRMMLYSTRKRWYWTKASSIRNFDVAKLC